MSTQPFETPANLSSLPIRKITLHTQHEIKVGVLFTYGSTLMRCTKSVHDIIWTGDFQPKPGWLITAEAA